MTKKADGDGSSVLPIRPEDVSDIKHVELPVHVIPTWNKLIAKAYRNGQATILQKDAINALGGAGPDCEWINIEDIYRKAGWHVEYDKPGYNETYEASFVFRKQKPKR